MTIRCLIVALCLAIGCAGCDGPQSMFDPQGPASRSIAGLGWLLLGVAAAIYLAVMGILAWALMRTRRPDDESPEMTRRLTAIVAAAVGRLHVLGAAEVLAKHLASIDQEDHRMPRFDDARIEVHAEIGDREAIFTVCVEVVAERHAAARAERKSVNVRSLIARRRGRLVIVRAGHLWDGFAHCLLCRKPCRGDVLIEKRRRDTQRGGDVVEAIDFDFGG